MLYLNLFLNLLYIIKLIFCNKWIICITLMRYLKKNQIKNFQQYIWSFYKKAGRKFIWRYIDDPYKIVVSEIMLQQTQTCRVIEKYKNFIAVFADFKSLASASLLDVLRLWQGLGYNRRGKYLHCIAQKVVNEFDGQLPNCPQILEALPGIGPATASSICAFAFNSPTVFIETNIRAVFIHHFFQYQEKVHDKEIFPLIKLTLDTTNPREWYYALMDYGVMLKKRLPNPNKKSKHYTKQSKFEGSNRQIRGMILKILIKHNSITKSSLFDFINHEKGRVESVFGQLIDEDFIVEKNGKIFFKNLLQNS